MSINGDFFDKFSLKKLFGRSTIDNIQSKDSDFFDDTNERAYENTIELLLENMAPLTKAMNVRRSKNFTVLGIENGWGYYYIKFSTGHILLTGRSTEAQSNGVVKINYPVEFASPPNVIVGFSCGSKTSTTATYNAYAVDKDSQNVSRNQNKEIWIAKVKNDGTDWTGGCVYYVAFGVWATSF